MSIIYNEGAILGFKVGIVLAIVFIILRAISIHYFYDITPDTSSVKLLLSSLLHILLLTYYLFQIIAAIILNLLLYIFLPAEYGKLLLVDNKWLLEEIEAMVCFFVIIVCLTFYGLICQKKFKTINKRTIITSAIIFIILNSIIITIIGILQMLY